MNGGNWAGIPLRTPELLLALLRGTRTAAGLEATAEWLDESYRRGVVVGDAEMAELNIEYHNTYPQWNYTIASWTGK
ncbi:MAG: ISAzo13-like element transposase-related protein [Gemmataceae bacterium]